jgi:hypothetical protein
LNNASIRQPLDGALNVVMAGFHQISDLSTGHGDRFGIACYNDLVHYEHLVELTPSRLPSHISVGVFFCLLGARLSELSATLLAQGAADPLLYYPVFSGERLTCREAKGASSLCCRCFSMSGHGRTAGTLC